MKISTFVITLCAAAASAIPLDHNKKTDDADWQLVPDAHGSMHLVDIHNYETQHIEPTFNATNDVRFRLFTRSNPTTPQFITLNNREQLANSFFNVNHQTRFQIHGWNGGGHDGTGASIRNAYINRGDFNVFTVDWGLGAGTPNYILARNRVNEVGQVLARFIDFLNEYGLNFSLIGVLGHSLGAQVAGAAGKRTTRGTLQFIVGMDPAGPLFALDDPDNRLHHTDANYVERSQMQGIPGGMYLCHDGIVANKIKVPHRIVTDAGRLGFQHPIADATFYPNWGTQQPGCGPDLTGQCGHNLASTLMVESINPVHIFGAIRCRDLEDIRGRNCVVNGASRRLGGEPVQDGPGIVGSVYFLTTNAASPFAHGPR